MSCEFCKDPNNIRAIEEKLGHEIEYCPNCGEPIYVVYALCAMKKAADKYLELHLLDGKRQETVEIDGVELIVEREKITDFANPKASTTNPRDGNVGPALGAQDRQGKLWRLYASKEIL